MGNCCSDNSNDFDIINIQLDKEKKSNDSKNQKENNTGRKNYHSNNNTNNNNPSNTLLSKKKLKLIIRQSKSLVEGKEYIINSLGLTNPINIHKDGLTIFGDTNVSKNNIIYIMLYYIKYRQIFEQILYSHKVRAILGKIMQKSTMIEL